MKNNLVLKLVALLVAVFIWLQLSLMTRHESETGLNLRLANAADTLRKTPTRITGLVEGRGLDILRLRFTKTYVRMEASDYWAGNALAYEVFDLPENLDVKVLGVIPPTLAERLKVQSADQRGQDTGSGPQLRPAGPAESKTEDSPGDQFQTRILTDLPIDAPRDLNVFPGRATLKVRGQATQLAKLPTGVRVYISAQADSRGLFELEVDLPQGVSLQDITPQQVRASR